jgi:Domain of unknown function (DUF4234)
MAEEVQIGGGPATAKIRHPVAVALLSLVTLGIYALYWWYQVNREMADLGKHLGIEDLGDNPTVSLLAWFPGFLLIVPPFVSLYNGVHRMKYTQELTTRRTPTLNGWIVLILLVFVLSVVAYGYMQAELNKAWRAQTGTLGPGASGGQTATAAEGQTTTG